ncbi:hypothetical protein TIFTF001_018672 [Ficus carica]|uniref:Uncharacterized protein n=1 Tax=Ficus carica TaxID=3494 RepID=A0AA88DBX3_FICCA|nr:hypothetical protein TIFTF001_018672 [Ficus carica]
MQQQKGCSLAVSDSIDGTNFAAREGRAAVNSKRETLLLSMMVETKLASTMAETKAHSGGSHHDFR